MIILPKTKLLDEQTTAASSEKKVTGGGELAQLQESVHYIVCDGTYASGTVVVEVSHDPDYTGAWSNVLTITPASNAVKHGAYTGPHLAIRHRISVDVAGGGKITSYIVGKK